MDVVYRTATSADGFIADAENSLEWLFEVPGADGDPEAMAGFLDDVGALVMGRTTYEWVLDHERLLEHPEKWHACYGERPTWVFSHRELPPIPGVDLRFVAGAVSDHHEAVAAGAAGRDVWLLGGGDLVGQYADAGLLDRIVLDLTPVFLGAGAPLLPRRMTSTRVRLQEVTREGQRVRVDYRVGDPSS
ncbi:dihydrofolate reductase [Nocardioides mangrovicus]|uniref:Dihydrofolate reductase n=1 Tax=Nocardioides mangrovicus TaxID=2478913 RepID=A0A3L8P0M4_9ACTN|nr:dihydrofolate reductase family protein [Nocardioides mangrovicus]RLV48996.1 dihydrofolate reductase [Nocardioides mangrovicus]